MELAIRIQVEELPEGLFLATSDELSGLVAQGRTAVEVLDIARDVARKLVEARREPEEEHLGQGATIDEFPEWFPSASRVQVHAVLDFAKSSLDQPAAAA